MTSIRRTDSFASGDGRDAEIDPFDGRRVWLGTFGTYYKRVFANGDIDLYSICTFFLNDPVYGDEIEQ